MTHVSLFTGIGGIDLAAEWAGFRTIVQVERDPYCLKVLERHWPEVHRCREIRDFPDEWFWANVANTKHTGHNSKETDETKQGSNRKNYGLSIGGSTQTRGTEGCGDYGTVTLVSGGFPCQPFSSAGKRRGKEDDRYLWPEMLRVIQAIKPKWVLAENVPGILAIESGLVFESVLTDLEVEGYQTWTGLIPAAGAGAPHFRYRIFVVANTQGERTGRRSQEIRRSHGRQDRTVCGESIGSSQDVAHATSLRCGKRTSERNNKKWFPSFNEESCDDSEKRSSGENVADTKSNCKRGSWKTQRQQQGKVRGRGTQSESNVSESGSTGLQNRSSGKDRQRTYVESTREDCRRDWMQRTTESGMGGMVDGISPWLVEPDIPRVARGVKDRVNKLRALGNAVVPVQVYPILQAIAEVA